MRREPMVFGDMPFSVQVCMIAGAIFLAPYLIIRAWFEGRREALEVPNHLHHERGST